MAVTVALVLPLLMVIGAALIELHHTLALHRRIALTAVAMADLAARSPAFDADTLADLDAAADALISPYDLEPLRVMVSKVEADRDRGGVVVWSWARGGPARATGTEAALPPTLAAAQIGVIVAEVRYAYRPPRIRLFTGPVTLSRTVHAAEPPRR